jgi:type VI secretion system protein ImpE
LLCFAGQYDRGEKQLNALTEASQDAEFGALLYRSALVAERQRQAFFESGQYAGSPAVSAPARCGTLNGKPFRGIEDLDPRIGPRLEMFVAGEYVWLPFEHIGSIHMQPPKFLRDTLWAAATVQTGPAFKGQDFGEVLIPILSPFSWRHESDEVKLGRVTDWKQEGDQLVPFGQKLLLLDDEEAIAMLDIRELKFAETAA